MRKLRLVLVAGIVLMSLLLSSIWYFKIDISKDGVFSLSSYTKKLLNSVDGTVQITYYVSNELTALYPQVRDIKDFLQTYTEQSRNVFLRISDPQKEGIEEKLTAMGISAQQIQSTEKNKTSFITVFSGILLEYGGKTAILPFTLSTVGLEYDLNSRLLSLTTNMQRKVAIYCGNELNIQTDYSYLMPWLESAGFTVAQISSHNLYSLDTTIPLLFIGSAHCTAADAEALEFFVLAGGKVFFAVSSHQTSIFTDWQVVPVQTDYILPLLEHWGFQLSQELVLDIANYRLTMQKNDSSGNSEYINYPFWLTILQQNVNQKHPVTQNFAALNLYWPSPMQLYATSDTVITPIIESSTASWLLPPLQDQARAFVTDPFLRYSSSANPKSIGKHTLAAALEGTVSGYFTSTKGSKTRLMVVADQYFLSNMVEYTNSPHNFDFLINSLLWLDGEKDLLAIRGKGTVQSQLYPIENTSENTAQFIRSKNNTLVLTVAIIPLLFIASGLLVHLRRNKNERQKKHR